MCLRPLFRYLWSSDSCASKRNNGENDSVDMTSVPPEQEINPVNVDYTLHSIPDAPNIHKSTTTIASVQPSGPVAESHTGSHSHANNTTESELAIEHVLCTACKNAVSMSSALRTQHPARGSEHLRHYADRETLEASASGPTSSSFPACHFCSLVLGKLREQERLKQSAATLGPVEVSLVVSRSGGVTLPIQLGADGCESRIGELVILQADDMNDIYPPTTGKFIFDEDRRHIYHNAQLAKSLASEASFSLAAEWLRQCHQTHARCAEASHAVAGRPTRLVDVGSETTVPRVVVVDQSQLLEYLTLSHCWGGATILRLLLENLDRLTSGFPMCDLPKTFRDAIMITRRLG
jgi:hypothetical protein